MFWLRILTHFAQSWIRSSSSLDNAALFLDTTERELFTASGIVELEASMSMPCTGSDGAGETMNLTVTITAAGVLGNRFWRAV